MERSAIRLRRYGDIVVVPASQRGVVMTGCDADWLSVILARPPLNVFHDVLVYEQKTDSYQKNSELGKITENHPGVKDLPIALFDKYAPEKDHIVLDVGAGGCNLSAYLQSKYKCRVCALDVCLEILVAGDAFLDYYNADRPMLKKVCASALSMPFKDESFDLVVGSGVLHHFDDASLVLIEVSRVLKPGGYAVFGNEMVPGLFSGTTGTSDEDRYKKPSLWKEQVRKSGLGIIEFGVPKEEFLKAARRRFSHFPEAAIIPQAYYLSLRVMGKTISYAIVLRKESEGGLSRAVNPCRLTFLHDLLDSI
jgi:ubiquinone/menaquinone biosynthesis C-methylase UbiE